MHSPKYMKHQKIYRILHQGGWKEARSLERKIITTSYSRPARADDLLTCQRTEKSINQNICGLPKASTIVVKMRT